MEMDFIYIDRRAIEEYFEDEYDFSLFSEIDWEDLDELVGETCSEIGVEPDFTMQDEAYVEICRNSIDSLMEGK